MTAYRGKQLPGTLNNQFWMNVWLNNHSSCKDLESSNWNNHLHMDVSASRAKHHPWSLTWLYFAKYIGNSRSWCGGWNIPSSLGKRKNIFSKVPVGSCIFEIFDLLMKCSLHFFTLHEKVIWSFILLMEKILHQLGNLAHLPRYLDACILQLVVLDFLGHGRWINAK